MSKTCSLIVENNYEDIKKIQSLLDSRDIEYDTANSAIEARLKIKEKAYSFIILDLDLGSGDDDGKFLLDRMLQEKLFIPTIILSNAGFLPDVIALKGKYEFVVESIDKIHLSKMLPVFDRAIIQSKKNKQSNKKRSNDSKNLFNLLGTILIFLLMFLVIIGTIVVTAKIVSPLLFGLVVISTILIFFAIGIFILKTQKDLSEAGFLEIAGKIIKSFPFLGRNDGENNSNTE